MRLPDFLIAGAMKAGTTTLRDDLAANPALFFPRMKEPACLRSDRVLSPSGQAAYAEHYQHATPEQRCGDASTYYTMLPVWGGVPRRARRLLGPALKLIYLVREPVARVISHHRHAWRAGELSADIDLEVRRDPRLLAFTRYAAQLSPWLDSLGRQQLRVVRFERMVQQRKAVAEELSAFIGVPPRGDLVDAAAVSNRAPQTQAVLAGWQGMWRSPLYQRGLRAMLPAGVRRWIHRRLLTRPATLPPPPAPATVRYVLDSLHGECERLQRLLGVDAPLWDLAAVERRHTQEVVA